MRKPPKNETLQQAAIRLAHEKLAGRLADIKTMSARLRLLQPYVPILKAKGIEIYPGKVEFLGRKPLRLFDGFFNSRQVQLAIDTFKEQGFKEIESERREYSTHTHIVLGKGHLQVCFDLDKPRTSSVAPVEPPASPGADQAAPTVEGAKA